MMEIRRSMMSWGLLAALVAGCSETAPPAAKAPTPSAKKHDHSGWWCDEHGIPEAQCSLCSARVAAECKRKGDWCQEHERAKSQCFKCDPSLKDRFAALYRAKYGKEPPPITDE